MDPSIYMPHLFKSSSHWQNTLTSDSNNISQKTDFNEESRGLANLGNCYRCFENLLKVECKLCEKSYCLVCDSIVHSVGKFKYHNRNDLDQEGSQNEKLYNIRVSEIKEQTQNIDLKKSISNLSITQKWDIIETEIQTKFNQMIDLLKERKQEIRNKLDRKKDEQLKFYFQNFRCLSHIRKNSASEDSVKRSQMSEKIQSALSKLKSSQCEHADENGKCLGKYQINSAYFTELKSIVEKIELKNVLLKNICPTEQEYKKKLRSSMLLSFNSPTNNVYSSGLRSPKSGKLSQSIWVDEPKNSVKLNEQENEALKLKIKLNEPKMLQKVKSQKLILKNKGLDVTSARGRETKSKKLEIMI